MRMPPVVPIGIFVGEAEPDDSAAGVAKTATAAANPSVRR